MKCTCVYVENFKQKWKQLGFQASEQRELELQLLMDPRQGADITGTGDLRKMRFLLKVRPKERTARIVLFTWVSRRPPIRFRYLFTRRTSKAI